MSDNTGTTAPTTESAATPPAPPYNPRPEWTTYLEKAQDPDGETR